MDRLAIIPARCGSKGLPDKNIRLFAGEPLLVWSIKAAKDSNLFSEIMVSTDSNRYRDIAMEYGADVPFLRDKENSSDSANTWDAVREVLKKYKGMFGRSFDNICLLQPTSPLRTAEDIVGAYNLFEGLHADSVVSVCELEHSINTINMLPPDMNLLGFSDSKKNVRRQDAEKYYRLNGAIYIQKSDRVLKNENLYNSKAYAFVMDKSHSIDIDDIYDFMMAETLFRYMFLS